MYATKSRIRLWKDTDNCADGQDSEKQSHVIPFGYLVPEQPSALLWRLI